MPRVPSGSRSMRSRGGFTPLALTGLAVALGLWGQTALAVIDVNKSFNPINILPGQTSTLEIVLLNSASVEAIGAAVTDTLPPGVTATAILENTCGTGSAVSIVPDTAVSLTGGTIPAGTGGSSGSCLVRVSVTSSTVGTWVNTIPAGGVSTDTEGGNSQAAEATLTVSTSGITGLKSFSPSTIHVGGSSLLTVTLNNPSAGPLTNLAFTDNFPVPLQIDDPVVTGGTCGALAFTDAGGGALEAGDTGFRVTGGTVPGGGSCTVTVRVRVNPARTTVAQASAVTNTIAAGAVTTAQGATNAAALSGSITVQTGAQVVKAFAPTPIALGGTSTLTLTLRNYNTAPIAPADLTDAMPAGITVVGPVATTCGGSASFTATEVQLAGGTIPGAPDPNASGFGSCTLTATVRGEATGALLNSVPAGMFSGISYAAASGTLTVQGAVGVSKAFSPANPLQGGTSTLTITLTNATASAATITSFTDDLTTMDAVGRITVGSAPPASTSCGGALTAVPGTTSITLAGGTIPAGPGGSCLITVPVAVGVSAPSGNRPNTIAVNGLHTSEGNNATAVTANLNVRRAAGVSKSWSPTTVAPGGVSRLTINVTHTNGAPAFTGLSIVDTLAVNHLLLPTTPPDQPFLNTCGGTVTLNPAARTVTLVGGSLGTGTTSCRIQVDVQAPATTSPVSARNRIPANTLVTDQGYTYNANADATLSWANRVVTLNKAFVPTVANGGGPSVAQVTIANTAPGAVNLTNVALTDLLPPDVEVHASPDPTFTGTGCSGGTITAVPGGTSFSLAGASINAGSVCTLGVTVTSYLDGNHINAIPAGAVSSAQGATNTNEPSATLTILRNINVTKSFSPNPVELGGTATLTIRIYNTNEVPRTLCGEQPASPCSGAPGLVDTLPAGLTVAAGTPAISCSGGVVVAPVGGGTVTVNDAVLAPVSACEVTVPVTAATAGAWVNTIGESTVRTVEGSTNPDAATSTLRVVATPTIAKVFSPASIAAGTTSTLTFTLRNPNAAAVLPAPGLTGASFSDGLSGMEIAYNQNAAGTCVGASGNAFLTGQTALSFGGLTIPPGSPGSCTVTIVVTAPAPGVYPNTTSGVLTNQTQTEGTPSNTANLTVLERPAIAKSFSPAVIPPGGVSTLTFTLSNPNAVNVTAGSPGFTDVFPLTPGAMTVASPLTTTNTCGGQFRNSANGTLVAGNVGIRFNSGTIPANGSCTISVNVTAAAGGTYTNTSSTLSTSNAGTSLAPATATLRVPVADLSVTKARSPAGTWAPGLAVTYTIVATNNGPDDAVAAPLTDDVPARLGSVTWSCAPEAACSPQSGSGNAVAPAVTLASGESVTLTVNAVVEAGAVETVTNTATVGEPANARDPNLVNNTAVDGAPTVPVTLSRVAVERRGRLLRVQWSTETEVGNVGFNLVGVRGAETIPLNDELIPGALDSLEPKTYAADVEDPGVDAVLVEERDTRGETRRHGPFPVGSVSGAEAEIHLVDWAAVRREHETAREEREGGQARAVADRKLLVAGAGRTVVATPRARLRVDRDGIVRVTAEALTAAGVAFDGQRLDDLAVESQGETLPLTVECRRAPAGRSRRFGPGCSVEFLGRGARSLHTRDNVYTLFVHWRQARRVPVEAAPPPTGAAPVSYRESATVDTAVTYSFASPTGDPWYETSILAYRAPVSQELVVEVESPEPEGAQALLHVGLWGVTDWAESPDHHVVVELNGTRLGERVFDGNTAIEMELTIPAGVLRAGPNTLRLTLPGDTGVEYDMVAVDRYGVTYDRAFRARKGELAFHAAGGAFAVRGLGGDVTAYRLADGVPAARLSPAVAGEGPDQVVLLGGASVPADYVVADASGLVVPRVSRDPGSSLALNGQADLLVVSHPAFLEKVRSYADARAATGLRIQVVDVEAAYDAFGGGVVGDEPIRELIALARERMGITSVLLVGGDTSDPFDHTGAGSLSFVPTPYTRTGPMVAFAPTDSLYGDVDGDDVPDVAIGRWPVRTVAELEAVIAKTLAFAARTDAPSVLLAADEADGGYSFAAASESFRALLPATWTVSKAYVDSLGVAGARQAVLEGLGQGPHLANWFGHSSYGVWSFDRLFTTADALALGNRGRPFVVTQWGCWNTYHVLPAYNTLGHALLLSPDGGAAAVIGPATLTDADVDRKLGELLLPRLTQPGTTLGRALNEAKRQLAASHPGARDVLLGTTLLGDPTLILPVPRS